MVPISTSHVSWMQLSGNLALNSTAMKQSLAPVSTNALVCILSNIKSNKIALSPCSRLAGLTTLHNSILHSDLYTRFPGSFFCSKFYTHAEAFSQDEEFLSTCLLAGHTIRSNGLLSGARYNICVCHNPIFYNLPLCSSLLYSHVFPQFPSHVALDLFPTTTCCSLGRIIWPALVVFILPLLPRFILTPLVVSTPRGAWIFILWRHVLQSS